MEKVVTLPKNLIYRNENALQTRLAQSEQRWRNLLGVSAALGVLSGLFGLVFSATNFLGLSHLLGHYGHLGTWLLIAFFPLMMLAAHAMDKAGEMKKKRKSLRLEKQGFSNGDR